MYDGETYFISNSKGTFYLLPENVPAEIKEKLSKLKPHTWIEIDT
jgi:hypothetical protein